MFAEPVVFEVHVLDNELQDGAAVGRGFGGSVAEQWDGLVAADGQRADRGRDLGEQLVSPDRGNPGAQFVEIDEPPDVGRDDAGRNELHAVSLVVAAVGLEHRMLNAASDNHGVARVASRINEPEEFFWPAMRRPAPSSPNPADLLAKSVDRAIERPKLAGRRDFRQPRQLPMSAPTTRCG